MRITSVTVMVFFFEIFILKILTMFKVLSQQLRGTLTTVFERHLTIKDFTDMDQHMCQACTKTFDLLFYASLFLKQT